MKQANSYAASSETVLRTSHAEDYATQLLTDLGEGVPVNQSAEHPAIAYRRSGLLQTTG
jgi:hypothetical protein